MRGSVVGVLFLSFGLLCFERRRRRRRRRGTARPKIGKF
jgi:hypothetical protein